MQGLGLVVPGVEGPSGRCSLKWTKPASVRNPKATSGDGTVDILTARQTRHAGRPRSGRANSPLTPAPARKLHHPRRGRPVEPKQIRDRPDERVGPVRRGPGAAVEIRASARRAYEGSWFVHSRAAPA